MRLIFHLLFFFLHLFFIVNNLFSQCLQGEQVTFQKSYGDVNGQDASAIIQMSDSTYTIVGVKIDATNNADLYVLKLDINGNYMWSKTYGTSGVEGSRAFVVEVENNGVVVSADGGAGTPPYILKLDSLGNLIWDKKISTLIQFSNGNGGLAKTKSGYFLFSWYEYFTLSNGGQDFGIFKVSNTGNLIWSKRYKNSYTSEDPKLIETLDGGILLTGFYSSGGFEEGAALKVDSNGVFLWGNRYSHASNNLRFKTSIELGNKDYLILGQTTDSFSVILMCSDSVGGVKWTKMYDVPGHYDVGNHFVRRNDGSFLIAASNGTSTIRDLLVMNVDSLGNLLDAKTYMMGPHYEEFYLWSSPIASTFDKGFIITGHTRYIPTKWDIFVIKADSCLNTYCSEQIPSIIVSSITVTQIVDTIVEINENNLINVNSTVGLINPTSINVVKLCMDTVVPACLINANFLLSTNNICQNESNNMTDLSTDQLANIVDWQWYFGDGDSLIGVQNATHLYNNAGTFNVMLVVTNDSNCVDSIVIPITVNPTFSINQNLSICQGDSVFLGGSFQNTAGIYMDSLQTIFGCDSIITTNLTVNPTYSSIQNLSICQGDSVLFGGIYYTTQGIFTDSLPTSLGCDSLINLNLTVNPSFQINQNLSICQGDSLFLGGSFQNSTGVYTDSLQTLFSCDSLIITNLTVSNNYNDSITFSICHGDSIFIDGNFQYTAGIYTDSLQTNLGCDSVITTIIVVNSLPIINAGSDVTITLGQSTTLNGTGTNGVYTWSPFIWLDCAICVSSVSTPHETITYTITVVDSNGCSVTDQVKIIVDFDHVIFVPNIFSPNGDGFNDILYVRGKGVTSLSFIVYDRWGEKVFETTDLNSGWDGTFRGKKMNNAVFVYYLKGYFIDESEFNQKGDITIIR